MNDANRTSHTPNDTSPCRSDPAGNLPYESIRKAHAAVIITVMSLHYRGKRPGARRLLSSRLRAFLPGFHCGMDFLTASFMAAFIASFLCIGSPFPVIQGSISAQVKHLRRTGP